MVRREDIHLGFIRKEPQTGSFKGLRYRLCKAVKETETDVKDEAYNGGEKHTEIWLETYIWPEPFSFENTEDSLKEAEYFPLTEEGCDKAVSWINDKWRERFS